MDSNCFFNRNLDMLSDRHGYGDSVGFGDSYQYPHSDFDFHEHPDAYAILNADFHFDSFDDPDIHF
jgi:hypothetical protein